MATEPIIAAETPVQFMSHHEQVEEALNAGADAKADFFNQVQTAFDQASQPVVAGEDDSAPEPVKPTPAKPAPAQSKAPAKPAPAPAPDSLLPAPPSDAPDPAPTDQPDPYALPADLDKITLKGKDANHWQKLKADRAAVAEKLRQVEAEFQAFRAKAPAGPADPALADSLKALQAERDQIRTQLEAVALERSPRFQQQFQPRLESALRLAQESVSPDQAARVQSLLAMPASDYRDQALDEIAQSLTGIRQAKFGSAVAEVDKLTLEKQQLLAQAKPVLESWQAQAKAQQDKILADRTAASNRAFDEAKSKWANTALLKDDGTPESKAMVARNQVLADKIFRGDLSHAELAEAAHWAAFGVHSAKQLQAVMAENAQLKSQMAKLGRADAGLGSDAGGNQVEEALEPGMSFAQAVARQAAKAGLR